MIKEDFLHFLWKQKQFNLSNLKTTDGSLIQMLDFGYHNHNAGPDFLNARINIDKVIWVGSVEIHVKSSDWIKHGHDSDPAYNNVILHVVFEEDISIFDENQTKIPCLELGSRIKRESLRKYNLFQEKNYWIPCEKQFETVAQIIVYQAIEKAALHRLKVKAHQIKCILEFTKYNWEYSFIILLFRYFGAIVNRDAFEMLGKSIPHPLLLKEKDKIHNLEALIYGQAGLLNQSFTDNYPNSLKNYFTFLCKKYNLSCDSHCNMKFMRMRPFNFPTIRISQLASVLFHNISFLSLVKNETKVETIRNAFKYKASPYWEDHYIFDSKSRAVPKKISKRFIDLLFINVISPFLYCYGNERNEMEYLERSLSILEQLPKEENKILAKWNSRGVSIQTALESQGLLELKKSFCDQKKCLSCPVGFEILKA